MQLRRRGGYCYPSIAALVADTSQNRKTVIANLQALVAADLIRDSGRRVGNTGQTIVYQIVGYIKSPENGTVTTVEQASTENGTSTKNGTVEESQKGDCSETVPKTGPVPKTDGKSPVFSTKESQKRYSDPSGTVREPSLDSRRAASGGSKTSGARDPAGEKAPPESTLDKALFAEARRIFGQSCGGQINTAIRVKKRPWVMDLLERCKSMDQEQARAYLAAALKSTKKPNGSGPVFP